MSALGDFLRRLIDATRAVVLCKACVLPTDTVIGPAGDFGVCERCQESVTSKTGVTVR